MILDIWGMIKRLNYKPATWNLYQPLLYGIMTEELVIREIRIDEAAGLDLDSLNNDEFRGHYAT